MSSERPATQQCRFIIEGYRLGRNVVEQTQCRRTTRHASGLCHQHRSDHFD